MNKITLEQYLHSMKLVAIYASNEGRWRLGQSIFNVFADGYDIAETQRGNVITDPFYMDTKITAFFEAILNEEALQYYYSYPTCYRQNVIDIYS